MTCVSMAAEKLTEDVPFCNIGGHMPDYPVRILERLGGNVHTKVLGVSNVVEDRELMTGQDRIAQRSSGRSFCKGIERELAARA